MEVRQVATVLRQAEVELTGDSRRGAGSGERRGVLGREPRDPPRREFLDGSDEPRVGDLALPDLLIHRTGSAGGEGCPCLAGAQRVGETLGVVDGVGRGRPAGFAHQSDDDPCQGRGEAWVDPGLVVLGQQVVPGLRRHRGYGVGLQALGILPLAVSPLLLGGEHPTHLHEALNLLVHAVPADPRRGLVARRERHLHGWPALELVDALLPGQLHLAFTRGGGTAAGTSR